MTWEEQGKYLRSLLTNLPSRCVLERSALVEGRQARDVLSEAERQCREAVDGIVRKLAKSESWPHLESDQQYFLKQRVVFAIVLTDALAAPAKFSTIPMFPNPPPSFQIQARIEWLLNAAWERAGVGWWLDRETSRIQLHHGEN
jgi:hypothetical protein